MMEHNVSLDRTIHAVHYLGMASDTFSLLKARRKEIAAESINLRQSLDALAAEDAELAAAEKVLLRFGAADLADVEAEVVDGAGKPAGTPTTPNMIMALLREAAANGKSGLEPREMMVSISKRWWPTVKSEDIGPTAWRMWKDGRLDKDGPLYSLKARTGGPVQSSAFD